jgi:tRNA (guanine10-N2)-dimethyltransferase
VPKFFFLLSGEHETLPFAELEAILESEGIAYTEVQRHSQVLRLDTSMEAVKAVKARAALTRICCQELFSSKALFAEIVKATQSVCLDNFLHAHERFAIRVRRVREAAPNLVSMKLEQKLGELFLSKVKGARVNLKHPEKTFFGTITDTSFILGLKLAEISPSPFMQRRPKKRPFFHPSAMPAKLARCMVNLAEPRKGDLLLDPFCGTGSFLMEAGIIGCRVLGFDASKHMAKGTLRNLRRFNIDYEGIAVAEAKHLPLAEVDCIVTDPPYGRSASTMGYTTQELIRRFLARLNGTVVPGLRICMAAPKRVHINKIGRRLGFRHIQSHFVYVHRSLTREIMVLEKT